MLKYLGPDDHFHITVGGKDYAFTSPRAEFAADGTPLPQAARGAPVAVNNDHVEEITTAPFTRWQEVADTGAPVAG